MKNITALFFLFFVFLTTSLFGQDEEIAWNNGKKKQDIVITPDKDVVWAFKTDREEKVVENIFPGKWPFRIPTRKVETGLLNINIGASNDFMTISEIFREKLTLDFDKLSGGLNININSSLSPVFFNYNKNNIWGYGFSTGLDLIGIIGLNGNMLTLHKADTAKSNAGAAVFSEVNVYGFLTFEKFKIKLKPAVYYPLLYAVPDKFSYTYTNKKTEGKDETYFDIGLNMRVYTSFPMKEDFDFKDIFKFTDTTKNISAKPGIDFSIGAEYPLSETLGLTEKINFLDFDVGVDLINIPLYPAAMEDYIRMIMKLGNDDDPITLFNDDMLSGNFEEINMDNFFDFSISGSENSKRKILRPFKMFISANLRPFDSPLSVDSDAPVKTKREWLTFTPILGFSINPLYYQPASFEGGIKTCFSLANFFITTINIGYYDRLWKNSLELALNLRIFEIDLGAGMQSADFLKSWSGGGFGASIGFKFGW